MKKWLLPAIILLGLGLRLWGIGFGLPGTKAFFMDESVLVNKAVAMGTGDLNPHFFIYPTFHIYLVAFVYGIIFVIGWFFGLINSVQDFQSLFFTDPTIFYLALRCLSALFGVATIWVVWKIGKHIYSEWAGLLGALFLSLCYLHVHESHFGMINIPMTFWTTLFALFLCKVVEQQKGSWSLSEYGVSFCSSLAARTACFQARRTAGTRQIYLRGRNDNIGIFYHFAVYLFGSYDIPVQL